MKILLLTFIFSFVSIFSQAEAQDGFLMTDTEKRAIKEVVREFISDNPEFLIEVLNEQAKRDAEEAQAQAEKDNVIEEIPDGLYDYPATPVAGNPDGDITIVEFFDYNCGFCKRVIGDINRIIEEDNDVRFLFKELPILSESSKELARLALAANMQGKYLEFHTKLMEHSGRLSRDIALEFAKELNLDIEQLKQDAESQDVTDTLAKNMELARELGARGTPFFAIGKQKVPGAIGFTRIKRMVAQERAKND